MLLFNCTCHLSITTLWILIFMEFKFSWVFIQETWLNFAVLVACAMLVLQHNHAVVLICLQQHYKVGHWYLVTHTSNCCYRAPKLAYPMHWCKHSNVPSYSATYGMHQCLGTFDQSIKKVFETGHQHMDITNTELWTGCSGMECWVDHLLSCWLHWTMLIMNYPCL